MLLALILSIGQFTIWDQFFSLLFLSLIFVNQKHNYARRGFTSFCPKMNLSRDNEMKNWSVPVLLQRFRRAKRPLDAAPWHGCTGKSSRSVSKFKKMNVWIIDFHNVRTQKYSYSFMQSMSNHFIRSCGCCTIFYLYNEMALILRRCKRSQDKSLCSKCPFSHFLVLYTKCDPPPKQEEIEFTVREICHA